METAIMAIGFLVAAYSIVANDAIQTLGTFIASNAKRPWWVLWAFGGGILAIVLVYGWWAYGGDVSYARLEKIPPPYHFTWLFLVPPVALLSGFTLYAGGLTADPANFPQARTVLNEAVAIPIQ